jgi:ankyrin repeat protein
LADLARAREENGRNMLHYITQFSHAHPLDIMKSIGEFLTQNWCGLNEQDVDGNSPLGLAIENKNSSLIDVLLGSSSSFGGSWLALTIFPV